MRKKEGCCTMQAAIQQKTVVAKTANRGNHKVNYLAMDNHGKPQREHNYSNWCAIHRS